ncbi:hypothetical protein E2P71_05075 [Candidatus Bathyarchaeota archaeon]|nr:hypothetical protein E2P71_05075 [Candidatus Bathyarchaeota archaeon]
MKRTTAFVVLALIMIQTIVVAGAQIEERPPPWRPRFNETSPDTLREFERRIETYVIGKIVISSLNFILYGYIAYFYTKLYRENNSRFSLVLAGLSFVLLVYSLSSNPLILLIFRGSDPLWMNVFNFIPDLLATVVAFMMIYLTKT